MTPNKLNGIPEAKTSLFLVDPPQRPTIGPVGQSSVLSQLRSFLPQMKTANEQLKELPAGAASSMSDIQIEKIVMEESSSDDDSDAGSASGEETGEEYIEEGTGETTDQPSKMIEIDLNLLRGVEKVEADDKAEVVDELPEGFRGDEPDSEEPVAPKKTLIEELN